jgi:hypothetical protein
MLRQDRFLLAILVGLAVLAIVAIVAVVAGPPEAGYLDEATPAAVVHNYVLALQNGDADRAYNYLAELPTKPTRLEFGSSYVITEAATSRASLEIGETVIDGDEAIVDLTVSMNYGGLLFLGPSYSTGSPARLAREDGEWRLVEMPYPWWDYSWSVDETLPYPWPTPPTTSSDC